MKSNAEDRSQAGQPTLRMQYEDLLHTVALCEQHQELLDTVVRCERQARVQDLIDAHVRFEQLWKKAFERPKREQGETGEG